MARCIPKNMVLPRDRIEQSETFSDEFTDVAFSKVGKWYYCVRIILKASFTSLARGPISCQPLAVCLKVEDGTKEAGIPGRYARKLCPAYLKRFPRKG